MMYTRWNRYTGSFPINDGDPQNDDPDVDVDLAEQQAEDAMVIAWEQREDRFSHGE